MKKGRFPLDYCTCSAGSGAFTKFYRPQVFLNRFLLGRSNADLFVCCMLSCFTRS